MSALLKDQYNVERLTQLAEAVHAEAPAFAVGAFLSRVFDASWERLELKARMRHISTRLAESLPGGYRRQLAVLERIAHGFTGFTAMVFPDFVEVHGLDNPDMSLDALEHFTRFSSSEFAVRPFIVRYERQTMKRMRAWSKHRDEHVRRLASEGCRPRLPWAIALPRFKSNPAPVLPILEALKADESEYVRRSVANNLNDIAKDHPDVTLALSRKWVGTSAATDALVKHACRTLLKRGNPAALALFGYNDRAPVTVEKLTLAPARVKVGDTLEVSFIVSHRHSSPVKLRLEYHVYFPRPSGKISMKVFQITERTLGPGRHTFRRRHSFLDRSTRVHHPGAHRISIAVNGAERASAVVRLMRSRSSTARK